MAVPLQLPQLLPPNLPLLLVSLPLLLALPTARLLPLTLTLPLLGKAMSLVVHPTPHAWYLSSLTHGSAPPYTAPANLMLSLHPTMPPSCTRSSTPPPTGCSANLKLPTVEVRAEKLTVKAPALVGAGAVPSVGRAATNTLMVRWAKMEWEMYINVVATHSTCPVLVRLD